MLVDICLKVVDDCHLSFIHFYIFREIVKKYRNLQQDFLNIGT